MDYKQLLDEYKSSNIFGHIINLVLVIFGARPALLFESVNYTADEKLDFFSVCQQIDSIEHLDDDTIFTRSLFFVKNGQVHKALMEDPNRINDDIYLGVFLGFTCIGHDYGNYKKTRIAFYYNVYPKEDSTIETNIIAEVCEFSENAVKKLEKVSSKTNMKINQILDKFGYVCKLEVRVIRGHIERYEELENNNSNYVKENINEYIDDFENMYMDLSFFRESVTYNQLLNINKRNIKYIKDVYQLAVIEEFFLPLFHAALTKDEIKIITKDILKKDSDWWKDKYIAPFSKSSVSVKKKSVV